jgi:hypothetical protein
MEEIRIELGAEYDIDLWAALRLVLLRRHAVELHTSWGLGGSQEIQALTLLLENQVIAIESETYMGLSIVGPRSIVEDLARDVHQQMNEKTKEPGAP